MSKTNIGQIQINFTHKHDKPNSKTEYEKWQVFTLSDYNGLETDDIELFIRDMMEGYSEGLYNGEMAIIIETLEDEEEFPF